MTWLFSWLGVNAPARRNAAQFFAIDGFGHVAPSHGAVWQVPLAVFDTAHGAMIRMTEDELAGILSRDQSPQLVFLIHSQGPAVRAARAQSLFAIFSMRAWLGQTPT